MLEARLTGILLEAWGLYRDRLDSRQDPRGHPYYWIGGDTPTGVREEGTDFGTLIEGLVSITQHPAMMPIYILGNCNTQIYLGLQHQEDIITASRALFLDRGDEAILDRLQVGEGIVKIKGRVALCMVRFPLVPVVRHNGGKN